MKDTKCELERNRQITDLSVECLLMILEKMETYDLIAVAETSEYFSCLAEDVFRRRYSLGNSSKIIDISGTLKNPKHSISTTPSQIFIENAEMAISVLHHFCNHIHRLSINFFYLTLDQRNRIENVVENACFESVNEVGIFGFNIDVLLNFTKPLTNVETIKMQGKFRSSAVVSMKLNEIFPNVRLLSLSLLDVFDPSIFDIQFPQLEHFDISLIRISVELSPQDFIQNMMTTVRNLLMKNPTIKSLILHDCHSMHFVKMASDYLPNLEEISIDFIALDEYRGEPMRFPSVKKLDFTMQNYGLSELMTFETIEDMKISGLADECIALIRGNPNIRKLNIFARTLSDQEILEIGTLLPNLIEFRFASEMKITANPIVQMIQQNTHLERIVLNLFDIELYKALLQFVSKEWIVAEIGYQITLDKISK